MTRPALAAAALCALLSCSQPLEPADRQEPRGAVAISGGSRYDKSSYLDDDGNTVLAFRIRVENLGDRTGRSPNPECRVVIAGERHDLQIYENPELAPGEHGWFRAGGPVPPMGHGEFDDLEPHCDL